MDSLRGTMRGTRVAGKDPLDRLGGMREAPGRQEITIWTAWEEPERHQGGRKGPFGQPERHQGGRKGLIGQLARHQGGRKGSIGQPARHQRATSACRRGFCATGALKSPLVAQDCLERPSRSTGWPVEFRFWQGAGFCLTFNTISMGNGPVRGKSSGGLHGRLPVAQIGL